MGETLPVTIALPSGPAVAVREAAPSEKRPIEGTSTACVTSEPLDGIPARGKHCVYLDRHETAGEASASISSRRDSDVTFFVPAPRRAQRVEFRGAGGIRHSGEITVFAHNASRVGVVAVKRSELPGGVSIYDKTSRVLLTSSVLDRSVCDGSHFDGLCTVSLRLRRPR